MQKLKFLLILLLVSGFYQVFAQNTGQENKPDYYKENFIRYQDFVYRQNIETVLLHPEGFELSSPIIHFNSDEKLKLGFDDLEGGQKNYRYTLILCTSDWHPVNLLPNQYLEGYTEDYIDNYKFSFNTLQTYTHYNLVFPTDNMKLKKSGNYIILVYPENDKENPVLTARFFVVDQKIRVEGEIKQATDLDDRYEKQQVVFSIFKQGFNIVNPYKDLKVVIQQNNRWDNAITNLQPLVVRGDELDYHHVNGNIFDGGNEFRHFDLKSLRYQSDRVKKMEPGNPLYEIFLMDDERRSSKSYFTEEDINGRRLIKIDEGHDSEIEADYVYVHFSLPYAPFLVNGNLYAGGDFNHWEYNKQNLMKYNFNRKAYELKMFLKQGYYNYLYVFKENGKSSGDFTPVEGNHFETHNEYEIFVYYRDPGDDFDQLIGIQTYVVGQKK